MVIYFILFSIFLFISLTLHLMLSFKNVKLSNKIPFPDYKKINRKLFTINLGYCILYSLINSLIFSYLTFILSGAELNLIVFIISIICSTTTTIFTAIKLSNKLSIKSLTMTYNDKYTENKIIEFNLISKKIYNCAKNNLNHENKYNEIFNTYLVTDSIIKNYFLDIHTKYITISSPDFKLHEITKKVIDTENNDLFDSLYLLTINDVVLNSMSIDEWIKLKNKLETIQEHINKELLNADISSDYPSQYKTEKDILLENILK